MIDMICIVGVDDVLVVYVLLQNVYVLFVVQGVYFMIMCLLIECVVQIIVCEMMFVFEYVIFDGCIVFVVMLIVWFLWVFGECYCMFYLFLYWFVVVFVFK